MTNEEILFKLRQDIRLRGLSPVTEEEYLMAANTFIRFYDNQPIFGMAEPEIRNYLIYLLEVKKLTPASINVRNSALRFLYGFTLQRNLNYRSIPRQKIVRKLPDIMTVEEIQALFDACDNLRDKTILMTIYVLICALPSPLFCRLLSPVFKLFLLFYLQWHFIFYIFVFLCLLFLLF